MDENIKKFVDGLVEKNTQRPIVKKFVSKRASVTIIRKSGVVNLSTFLTKQLDIKDGMSVSIFTDPTDPRKVFVGFVENDPSASIKVRAYRNTTRFMSRDFCDEISEIFMIGYEKSVPLNVNIKQPLVKVKENGMEVKLYQIFDVPLHRIDLSAQQLSRYIEYMNLNKIYVPIEKTEDNSEPDQITIYEE